MCAFNKYLLHACGALGPASDAGHTRVSETENTCPHEAYVLVEEPDSKINKTYSISHVDKGHREK